MKLLDPYFLVVHFWLVRWLLSALASVYFNMVGRLALHAAEGSGFALIQVVLEPSRLTFYLFGSFAKFGKFIALAAAAMGGPSVRDF